MTIPDAGDEAGSTGNVASVRAREQKLSKHRTIWSGVLLFGLVLMAYAGWMEFGVEQTDDQPLALGGSGDVGAQSAIQTSGAATWSPVLVFGAVTTGIGLLGFSLAGGLRSFLDFMRTDPH